MGIKVGLTLIFTHLGSTTSMKLLIVIASLVAISQAISIASRAKSHGAPDYLNFKCKDLDNGYYADRLRGCHQYYQCVDGVKDTHFCTERDTLFSESLWACVPMASYSCPSLEKRGVEMVKKSQSHGTPDFLNFKCEGKADGFYADLLRRCHQYYLCRVGEKTTYFCDDHQKIFDPNIRACVLPTSYSCPDMKKRLLEENVHPDRPDDLDFSCEKKKNGYYADKARGCQVFYHCTNEEKSQFSCAIGTLFDTENKVCNWAEKVKCKKGDKDDEGDDLEKELEDDIDEDDIDEDDADKGENDEDEIESEDPNKHPDRPDDLDFCCKGRKDGYYADKARGCHVFYYCQTEQKHQFNCAGGTLFNAKTNVCDWASNVKCKNRILGVAAKSMEPALEADADADVELLEGISKETEERVKELLKKLLEKRGINA